MSPIESHATACILCSRNCGIVLDVDPDRGRVTKVRGDEAHILSQGYICQKAARLDHYQNNPDRLERPLRRRADGSFEEISWDVAVREVAARIVAIREARSDGGRSLAYYGGGGQGNHLGGVFGNALVKAMRTRYHYSSLAQEKTGDFWVNGRLYGKQTCHTTEDVEHADVVLFIGTNPWQAHGIRNARDTVKELARDGARKMFVIDPRRTETAELADLHLQLRPGTDAWLLSAILAVLVQEELVDRAFLERRTVGAAEVAAVLAAIDVEAHARIAGVDAADVRTVARALGAARAACVRADLGIQQTLHSTLNSYLEKLLYLLTGNLGKPGGNNFHTFLLPLIGHSDEPAPPGAGKGGSWTTAVTGMPEISKLFPPNVLPAEILSERPDRIRGLVVDSANPMRSGADTAAYTEAFGKLDLLVVIDVAMTETARLAHYVLPAATQLEKWEATFFNLEFPTNVFHLRAPVLAPRVGPLPEPEIYRRLLVAMGEIPESFPLLERVAALDRRAPRRRLLPLALRLLFAARPKLRPYGAFVLAGSLGRALPGGAEAAAPLWMACRLYAARHEAAVRRTGLRGSVADLGEGLFTRILEGRSGAVMSTHEHEDTWRFIRHGDGKVHLAIPELLQELAHLEAPEADADFPLVLIAGERRSYNANTIFRDPAWRKNDPDGALRIHPDDARALGLGDGARATCSSRRGSVGVRILHDDSIARGVVTLPHGYGTVHRAPDGTSVAVGPNVNDLTWAEHRDAITATPFHKHVPVRLAAAAC